MMRSPPSVGAGVSPPIPPVSATQRLRTAWRALAVTLLGFASGLPLALTGQAMQAWLSADGIDVATIGFLSLVGLPYTFKFLWAPLMDRFEPPLLHRALGRRRGWLVVSQLALAGALWALAATDPAHATKAFAAIAVAVAFLSASQDVVIDAYRTDVLPQRERGLGASLGVLGYRLAMILSGGIALIWTDPSQSAGAGHSGWTWPEVYRFMAGLMAAAAVVSLTALPRLRDEPADPTTPDAPRSGSGLQDLRGFAALLAAVALGVWASDRFAAPLAHWLLATPLSATALPPALQSKWIDLAALLLGIAVTLPLGAWAARAARFDTLLQGLRGYFAQPGAGAFLAFIVLYKLGDAFAGSLMTPFLLQALAYPPAEVGVVNKVLGLWLTLGGALLGGVLMLKLGLWRSLLLFGVAQMASNLGFWWLAQVGKGAMPLGTLPAFDWGFVRLAEPTALDGGLVLVIALENITGGMGTAAFVACLMSLTQQRYTATQYALLSAFASVGRVWVGPLAGVLAESIGWPAFFLVSTGAALPALWLLWRLRGPIDALDVPTDAPLDD